MFRYAVEKLTNFVRDDEAATAVEYAVMLGLVVVAVIAVLALMGVSVNDVFTSIANLFQPSET